MSRMTLARRCLLRPRFLGLAATSFALGLAYSFVIPFMSLWGTQIVGMSPLVFGWFMAITSVSGIGLSTMLARWSDAHLARRSLLLLAGGSGALGYVGYAFVHDVVALTAIGSLALGTASVAFSQLFAHAREELASSETADEASFFMGVLRAGFALSWTVGPALAALIVARHGYTGVFLTAAGIFMAFLLGVWWLIPAGSRPPPTEHRALEGLGRLLLRRRNLCSFSSFVLIFGAFALSSMNLPLFITHGLDGRETDVGIAFGIAALFEVPFMLWFGSLASRGHQTPVIRAGLLVGAMYFLAVLCAQSPLHVYPAQLLNAACVAVTASVAIPFFQDLMPGQVGLGTTMYSSAYSLGNLLGYLGFGVLAPSLGHRGLFWICTALSAAALGVFVVGHGARRTSWGLRHALGAVGGASPPAVEMSKES
jgi:MFS transporter, SET family, sugar efflux transporter